MDNIKKRILLTPFNILYRINPELSLRLLFRLKVGYPLDLANPKTYNEKLQWLKLHDRNPLMPICCDKYSVRGYVEGKGCGDILNTLLWQGDDPADIPFDSLPDRFVIKVTHGSSFNIICRDKGSLDREAAVIKCRRWLKERFLPCYGEWFYGVVKPKVVVEKYLDDGTGRLRDYKIYCFNGKPAYIGVDTGDENGTHCKDIYDTEWKLLKGYEMAYPPSGIPIEKPACLEELLRYAAILSEDFIHARTDFYIVDGHPVFGEITFTNSAGFGKVKPERFALEMGRLIELP